MKIGQQNPFSYRSRQVGVQVCLESSNHRIRALSQSLPIAIECRVTMIVNVIHASLNVEVVDLPKLSGQLKHQIPIDLQTTRLLAQSPAVSSLSAYTTPAR